MTAGGNNFAWTRGRVRAVALLLGLVTLLVYLPVRRHGFIELDDADYVADNAMVQAGLTWAGVTWAFTTGHASNWHPVTWLSHQLDAELFGPGATGPHLVNALLHAANAVLLFLLLRRLTGSTGRSVVVAALFALHPLHVESVAWIAERKDVLSACFFLLTLGAYARYAEAAAREAAEQRRWNALALGLFALGLMTKPMLVTLPCVLLLLDYWPLQRFRGSRFRALVQEKLPFFALSAASCVITYLVQQRGGAVRSLGSFSFGERIGNALVSYARYVGNTFWPDDLAVFYPHPGAWPASQVVLAAVVVGGLSVAAWGWARRRPYVAVGWLWFAGMLVPTIGLVQAGNQALADRYTYLPLIGGFVALVWGGAELGARGRVPRLGLAVAATVAIALCAWRTTTQVRHWRSGEALFGHAVAVTTENFVARHCLGHALLAQGRTAEAIAEFDAALTIQPRFAEAHNSLGSARLRQGRAREARAHFEHAIELQPEFALARYNLGTVLLAAGKVDEAITQLEKACGLQPQDYLAQLNLGNALLQAGRGEEAVLRYRAVLTLRPDCADAHNNLGHVRLQQGRVDEATGHFRRALALQPNHANAHFNLGDACARAGRLKEAAEHFRKTLALVPNDADARQALTQVLAHEEKRRGATAVLP
jgi:protein O-mannosyl-transferase